LSVRLVWRVSRVPLRALWRLPLVLLRVDRRVLWRLPL
jgi:hypothetical protein